MPNFGNRWSGASPTDCSQTTAHRRRQEVRQHHFARRSSGDVQGRACGHVIFHGRLCEVCLVLVMQGLRRCRNERMLTDADADVSVGVATASKVKPHGRRSLMSAEVERVAGSWYMLAMERGGALPQS